jgi:hypothetical protein
MRRIATRVQLFLMAGLSTGDPRLTEKLLHTLPSRTRTVLGYACARSDTLAALGPKVRLIAE